MTETHKYDQIAVVRRIYETLSDKKGMNILALDVRGVCLMTDFFIFCEGTSHRHVKALSDAVVDICQREERRPKKQFGGSDDEWIALDFGDIVVHVFTSDMRHRYNIEEVWKEGRVLSL